MTNTDSRNVAIEELAPWEYAELGENDEAQITTADVRELAAYDFDSDNRTLVGLGPVERARRARHAAEIADSERMPHSEPPGPFIAADGEEDDELLRSLRGRRPGPWVIAVPLALLVAAAGVAVVRGLALRAPPTSQPPVAARASQPAAQLPVQLDAVRAEPAPAEVLSAQPVPAEVLNANERDESEPLAERHEVAPRSVTVKAPIVAAALPVTLPEQPPLGATDLAPGATDANVGSLNVTSSPPANVLLDGRPLGKAPRLVPVAPGVHTVLFIHPLYGRRTLSVKVSAGRTTNASADF